MFRSSLVLSLVSLAAAGDAQAQQDTTGLVPGRRIRIHQQDKQTMIGSFISMDAVTLALVTSPGDTVLSPRANIEGIDFSTGTKSRAGKGALTGAAVGAAAGALLGLGCEDEVKGVCIAGGALVAGALGAGVGALIGSGKRTDKWAPTAWPTLSFQPSRRDGGTVAIGMHLTF